MLYREIIAVCPEIHTKHINTLYGQSVELLNFKAGGTYSDHWGLKNVTLNSSARITSLPLVGPVMQWSPFSTSEHARSAAASPILC